MLHEHKEPPQNSYFLREKGVDTHLNAQAPDGRGRGRGRGAARARRCTCGTGAREPEAECFRGSISNTRAYPTLFFIFVRLDSSTEKINQYYNINKFI